MISEQLSVKAMIDYVESLPDEDYLRLRKARKSFNPEKDWLFSLVGGKSKREPLETAINTYLLFLVLCEQFTIGFRFIPLPRFAYPDKCLELNQKNIEDGQWNNKLKKCLVTNISQGSDGIIELEPTNLFRLRSNDQQMETPEAISANLTYAQVELGDIAVSKVYSYMLKGSPVFLVPYRNKMAQAVADQNDIKGFGLLLYSSLRIDQMLDFD